MLESFLTMFFAIFGSNNFDSQHSVSGSLVFFEFIISFTYLFFLKELETFLVWSHCDITDIKPQSAVK